MSPPYLPRYTNSWALVIGINRYGKCGPLEYARNDAEAFADQLTKLGFAAPRITRLMDGDATKAGIMESYLRFTNKAEVQSDDRIVVFFAGHGHTESGHRGEVGFLVPVDGCTENLESLIRWDELTRNADLIPAKHVMFVMDACFSGLMFTRRPGSGTKRFLRDMLQRRSRQGLAAGKGDQTVADSGGPWPGHSIFTGHLLAALGGAAAHQGVLTASMVMAYVHDRVATDNGSHQTPHYGFIDGDGDLILEMPPIAPTVGNGTEGDDVLVAVPAGPADQPATQASDDPIAAVKEYLLDPKYRIKLDDVVTRETCRALSLIARGKSPLTPGRPIPEHLPDFLARYEAAVEQLSAITALITRWGSATERLLLSRIFAKLAEANLQHDGMYGWPGIRWYPTTLLLYTGGIAALYSENYENLAAILTARVPPDGADEKETPVVIATVRGMQRMKEGGSFKSLPGYERYYAPESEYLFKAIQPSLEDVLTLGSSYERLFDAFEVLLALVFADIFEKSRGAVVGPVGRFGWKYCGGLPGPKNPFWQVTTDAEKKKAEWPPLRAGLFSGSYDRFKDVSERFQKDILNPLAWV